ncbi:SAM-dependent methyltransferase [Piscibacillus salipiscarius]|uniref:SAM-dependent methyltransferase n=1 Tax=Piscibacillus salipiscarius TaxID=299480 RepID=UPI000AEABE69|nr:class I SAM-dependent methyltransferase [Piscibacillus salipiscarius]
MSAINHISERLLTQYGLDIDDEIFAIQLLHRMNLVKAFGIQKGMNVLEIGCGQGETTIAIADQVGEEGRVTAIDMASRDYGAPLTLGEATDQIKNSKLGERIQFHFETDFLSLELHETFDAVVLSHSSWYFKNPNELKKYFRKMQDVSNMICVADWDIDFMDQSQRSHFCAATIQALYSHFVNHDGNIQNLFHKSQLKELLEGEGFQIAKQDQVDATYLQDVQWEKAYANDIRKAFMNESPKFKLLVNSYYELMNEYKGEEKSLNSFIMCAYK